MTYHNDHEPVDPSPASCLDQISASNRPDARSEKRSHSPCRHCATSLLDGHDVCDTTATDSDGHGSSKTHEESEGHKHWHVLGESGSDGEDGKKDVTPVVEESAAVDFAERGDHKGTEGKTENVDRNNECGCHG